MPQNHDYSDTAVEKRLEASLDAASILARLNALPPFGIELAKNAKFVDLAKVEPIRKAVHDLLPGAPVPRLFSVSYELKAGTHHIAVRGKADQSFKITCRVYPKGKSEGGPEEADQEFGKFLAEVRNKGALDQVCSPNFIDLHVVEREKLPNPKHQGTPEFAALLKNVMRGKATTVIVVDQKARHALVNEVIDHTENMQYSNAGHYTSRESFDMFDLNPDTGEFNAIEGHFHYSVYHEKADALWRISHYEGTDAKATVSKKYVVADVIKTAYDRSQTLSEAAEDDKNRAELAARKGELKVIGDDLENSRRERDDADKQIAKFAVSIPKLKSWLDDYPAYVDWFRAENPEMSLDDVRANVDRLTPELARAQVERDKAKPLRSRLTNALEGRNTASSKDPQPSEGPETAAMTYESLRKEAQDADAAFSGLVEVAKDLSAKLKIWEERSKNFVKFSKENQPSKPEEIQAQLERQREAEGEAQKSRSAAASKFEGATLRVESTKLLRKSIEELTEAVLTPPGKYRAWIMKLRDLTAETDRMSTRLKDSGQLEQPVSPDGPHKPFFSESRIPKSLERLGQDAPKTD